jgi:hypothetical protein
MHPYQVTILDPKEDKPMAAAAAAPMGGTRY